MLHFIKKNIFRLLLMMMIGFSFSTKVFAFEDAIIAIVNDELVTLKDLKETIRETYAGLRAQGKSDTQIQKIMPDIEKQAFTQLIENKLILSASKKIKLEVRPEAIDEKIKEIKKRYASDDQFMQAMLQNGATITDLRSKIEENLMLQYIVEYKINSTIKINPQEVTDYYDSHLVNFQRKARVNLNSIFISFGTDKAVAQAQIEAAHQKITDGIPFEDVAKEYSESPSIGIIERGQLQPDIEETVFLLLPNKISDIVKVETGFYIFKVNGKTPAEVSPLKEVKDDIQKILYREKFQEKFTKWIETLKKDAYIEIKQENPNVDDALSRSNF